METPQKFILSTEIPMNDDETESLDDFQNVEDLIAGIHVVPQPEPSVPVGGFYGKAGSFVSSVVSWVRPSRDIEMQLTVSGMSIDKPDSPEPGITSECTEVSETVVEVKSVDISAEAVDTDAFVGCDSVSSFPGVNSAESVILGSCSSSSEWDVVNAHSTSPEMSVESAILWCLTPAIFGIRSIGVLPASERAAKLITACDGDTNAAVVLAAGGESGGVKRRRIIFDFLIRQVPFVGCPAYILTSTWTHLRAITTIAAIHGHDLHSARTQHEVLYCLLPAATTLQNVSESSVANTAKSVASSLVSISLGGGVTDLLTLGTDLWAARSANDGEFECLSLGPSATARHFFCPENGFNLWKLAAIFFGVCIPWVLRIPIVVSLSVSTICWQMCVSRFCRSRDILAKGGSYLIFSLMTVLPVLGTANGVYLIIDSFVGTGSVSGFILGVLSLNLVNTVHVRKFAVIFGIFVHFLPLMDVTDGLYTQRVEWMFPGEISRAKSVHYLSVLTSSWFQKLLLIELSKREVVLQLLGAERVMILSLTLFFRGISAAVSKESLLPFFKQITPHPLFCCTVMTVRKHTFAIALIVGIAQFIPKLFLSFLSMLTGLLLGVFAIATLWNNWRINENTYLSNLRLLYILPGSISQKSSEIMHNLILSSGKSAMKSVLIQWAKSIALRLGKKTPL